MAARSRARYDLRMPLADSSGPKWSKPVREEVNRRLSLRGMLARWLGRLFGRSAPPPQKPLPPPTPIGRARTVRTSSRMQRSIVTGTARARDEED
jgi:hypothetical protein